MTFPRYATACLSLLMTFAASAHAEDQVAAAVAKPFDLGIEFTVATDYMDTGLTNSDHKPSYGVTLSPSYDIFYGTIYGATIDYGSSHPWLESKFAVGATPTFGKLSVDFNLARRIKFDDPSADRWLPYVTGTYTFNDKLSASLAAGYYAYDDPDSTDFWEVYAASTVTLPSAAYFTGELYWEPNSDGNGNAYYATYGTVGVPILEKFELISHLGYEIYEDNKSSPSYIWGDAGIKYAINDKFSVFVGYHFNDLSATDCPAQAYTDCRSTVLAKLTYTTKISDLFGRREK
jgi:hypothetical protein